MTRSDEARDKADHHLNAAVEALTANDDHLTALAHTERAAAYLRTLEQTLRAESLTHEGQNR